MTIEEELKQRKFVNSYQKLALNLIYSSQWLEMFLKDFLKTEELTLQQYNILRILRGSKTQPLSTLQIRERMMEKMSDTSRIVDRLILKKLASKKISPQDNRLVDVRITPKGLAKLKKLDDIDSKISTLLGNLSEKEALLISDLLDKMHA